MNSKKEKKKGEEEMRAIWKKKAEKRNKEFHENECRIKEEQEKKGV